MNKKTIACLITHSCQDRDKTSHALDSVKTALTNDQTIDHIFFYADGVDVANADLFDDNAEFNPTKEWQHIAVQNGIPLVVCVTAAENREIVENTNLAAHFEAHGMSEFFSRLHNVEQLVQL